MSLVMVAESLVAVLLSLQMEMIKPWFGVIILAALTAETPPLPFPAMQLVARQKEAEFPAVIARVRTTQMVEAALGYVKTSLSTVLVVHASFSMFAKTVMQCLALTADVGTSMLVLSLLNTAERPGTNVSVMIV